MRFYEFSTPKHIKPLSPPEARIYKLRAVEKQAKANLKKEREAQKRQKALVQQSKKLGRNRPTNNPNQRL